MRKNKLINICYQIEKGIDKIEFIDILISSGLAERRPVKDEEKINRMSKNANLIITARLEGKLIGISRSLTDFTFCTYLSDLVVEEKYQHCGIGKRLVTETQKAAPEAMLILLAAPAAEDYYSKIGMKRFEQCYII